MLWRAENSGISSVVEVQYEGQIPDRIFEGKMQRDIPLSSALKILELNKINFRVDGRKIIVTS